MPLSGPAALSSLSALLSISTDGAPARIHLEAINQDDFSVSPTATGHLLIVPRASKHRWAPEERVLRSLLVDPDGTVRSSGFPKFHNYGEHADGDALFEAAMATGDLLLTDKADGSLIIADRLTDRAHFRTRGQGALGDFEPAVRGLIDAEHPRLVEYLATSSDAAHLSLLFEYCAPDNRIILKYPTPQLILLGAVDKHSLTPIIDLASVTALSAQIGVPSVSLVAPPASLQALLTHFAAIRDTEGVVARFADPTTGAPVLIKCKTDWYRRLHAIRFGMTPARTRELAYIVGLADARDAETLLAPLGFDFEMVAFVRDDLAQYTLDRAVAFTTFARVQRHADDARASATAEHDPRAQKKTYVKAIRTALETDELGASSPWFAVAMALWDTEDGETRAAHMVHAMVLDVPVTALTQKASDLKAAVARLMGEAMASTTDG